MNVAQGGVAFAATTNTGLVRLRSGYVSGGLVADFHLSERNSSSHSQTVSVGLGTRIELGGNIAKVMWVECKGDMAVTLDGTGTTMDLHHQFSKLYAPINGMPASPPPRQ